MIDLNHPEIEFAIQTVRQACMLASRIQQELVVSTLTKSDRSPVTVADYACQALVAYSLQQAFPNEMLVAEENASELRMLDSAHILEKVTSFVKEFIPQATPNSICDWIDHRGKPSGKRFWTLDPIDGTKGFLRNDQYAVALALVEKGSVQIGVLGCPNLGGVQRANLPGKGTLAVAAREDGSWSCALDGPQQFSRLQVSNRGELRNARLLRSFESGHTNEDQIAHFLGFIGTQEETLLMDSQAKYILLASGEGDLLLRMLSKDQPGYREKIWDQAAGSILLEEAGGKITDLYGHDLDFSCGQTLLNNRGILATNGRLHASALEVLQSIEI